MTSAWVIVWLQLVYRNGIDIRPAEEPAKEIPGQHSPDSRKLKSGCRFRQPLQDYS